MKETLKTIARFVGTAILILSIVASLIVMMLMLFGTARTVLDGDLLLALWNLITGTVMIGVIGSAGTLVASVLIAYGESHD